VLGQLCAQVVFCVLGFPVLLIQEPDVTRRKEAISLLGEIQPAQFYRITLAPAIFGIGWQACRNKILAGELPIPSGDPQGWLGSQILEHRAKMQALAEKRAATDAARPRQEQPAGFKRKKLKLRTSPSPLRSRKSQSQSA